MWTWLKFVCFILIYTLCNLFQVLGLFIVALGVIVQVVYFNDPQLVEYNFLSGPGLLILIGAFVFLIAFVGCCGAMKESHRMITMVNYFVLVTCLLYSHTNQCAKGTTNESIKSNFECVQSCSLDALIVQI